MKNFKSQKGFSVLEVILASALFVIFSSGVVGVVLQGYQLNRLAEEETIANQYAVEGIEAARSIRNQSYLNLLNTAGSGIVASSSGFWKFSGTNNQFGTNNKFTRVIKVSSVQRDGSGNIVVSGGTLDPDTKKIESTVSWNASPTRNNSVVLSTYFTNWKPASPPNIFCSDYCQSISYTTGVCRNSAAHCTTNGETNEPGGDIYCTSPSANRCCCD